MSTKNAPMRAVALESDYQANATPPASTEDDMYSFEKKNSESISGPYKTGYGIGSRMGKLPTGTSYDATGARPMTSVRAAGFTRGGRSAGAAVINGQTFDPMNQAKALINGEKSLEQSMEDQISQLEKKVNSLLEESCITASEGNYSLALEKAKEAGKKERQLSKQREQANLADQVNLDLTYSVLFNLANLHHANKMYQEALNSYAVIVKNKLFNQSGRLRVNMGNIYCEQKKYAQAVKMYRMALDQIPVTNKDMRVKIMRNVGNAFVNLGQYQDAITSYESIVDSCPDFQAGFNLALCYFAIGDKDRMRRGFQKLISMKLPTVEQFGESEYSKDEPIEDHDIFQEDQLRAISREKKKATERYIMMAAKLIAPAIGDESGSGYDWVVEAIRSSPHSEIASELEIAKSIQFLKTKDFSRAIEALKGFEKKDHKMLGTAATNLSFLYFLESDYKNAEKYAEVAISSDKYNSKAQTNMGNCYFQKGDLERAKKSYIEAISVDAVCAEALYNLGLVCKKLEQYPTALNWFEKLHAILRNNAEVIYQIADIHDRTGNLEQATEWLNILISVVPTDPGVLARLGDIFSRENDKSRAFQYYSESYRYYPSNLDVLSWMGAYYVECEVYEQAVQFFERAALIQPQEVKWQLMIASCYRRSGNYQQAFENYKKIHGKFSENVECLRFLVRICTDLGMKELLEFTNRLSKLEQKKRTDTSSPSVGEVASVGGRHLKGFELERVDPNVVSGRKTQKTENKPSEDTNWAHEDVDGLLPE